MSKKNRISKEQRIAAVAKLIEIEPELLAMTKQVKELLDQADIKQPYFGSGKAYIAAWDLLTYAYAEVQKDYAPAKERLKTLRPVYVSEDN